MKGVGPGHAAALGTLAAMALDLIMELEEAADLLHLLELQLKLEQIDPDHANEVAEDRLRHYSTILDQVNLLR